MGLGLADEPLVGALVGLLFTMGLPVIVAKLVAERGRRLEQDLYKKWGGPPTTLLLLPPPDASVSEVCAQRRERLQRLSGVDLPLRPDLGPGDADAYQAATLWLIANTRDHARFPVVWSELKSYGFERNLLSVRPLGLATSAVAVLALTGGFVAGLLGFGVAVLPAALLWLGSVLLGLMWFVVPSEKRVRTVGDRYAARLLDASAALP